MNLTKSVGLIVPLLLFFCTPAEPTAATRTAMEGEWTPVDVPESAEPWVALAAHPSEESWLYAATPRDVYQSSDGGKSWQHLYRLGGKTRVVPRGLAVGPSEPLTLLLATTQGLQGSFDSGKTWNPLKKGLGEPEAMCTTVAFHPAKTSNALVGTQNGLFVSSDGGLSWQEVSVPSAARNVIHAAWDLYPEQRDRLYVLSSEGLFAGSLGTGNWQKLLGAAGVEETVDEDSSESDEPNESEQNPQEVSPLSFFQTVAVDNSQPSTLYVGTTRGLKVSYDRGKSWQWLSRIGLGTASIHQILFHGDNHSDSSDADNPAIAPRPKDVGDTAVQSRLGGQDVGPIGAALPVPQAYPVGLHFYVLSSRGPARYDAKAKRWSLLNKGLVSDELYELVMTSRDLWVATHQGLLRLVLSSHAFDQQTIHSDPDAAAFEHEPTITQVREAAIRYAEVHPQKIASWRKQAKWRAILPDLSFSAGTNLTDFRHWDSGTNPDSLLRGERDIDWNASVSWELGDLIWNDDQTSIDSRSKLMVELRDDIIDEVTRLYFERRRLQTTRLADPPQDPRKNLEQDLRIQELTALLDGFTGGAFSYQIEHIGARR